MNLANTIDRTLPIPTISPNVSSLASTRASSVADDAAGPLLRSSSDHHATHTIPSPPARRNTTRQPSVNKMRPTKGAASTDPTAVPALMIPTAVERSSGSIHSETTRTAAGNAPPSPIPRRNLATSSSMNPDAAPCSAHATDHQTMMTMNPRRVPMRSSSRPPTTYRSEEHTSELESRQYLVCRLLLE